MTKFTWVMFAAVLSAVAFAKPINAQTEVAAAQVSNPASREAQEKLVEGLNPVKPIVRFRRSLNAPKAAGLRSPEPPSYLGSTEEAQAGYAELEKIRKNVADSGWPEEPWPGRERVIFASDAGTEIELEYDINELMTLGESAMKRGINNASADGGGGKVSAAEISPLAWSNGIDSRVDKSISATYPINHRVLRRIGELNGGGCSGALIGRRLVLTAAHCIVRADLSYNKHAFRARRSGNQMPYGTVMSIGYWYASQWVSNDCHTNRRWDPCSPHDWAVLLLPDNAWNASPNGSPGWMGYWVYGQNFIMNNAVSHNDGYPACGFPSSPAGCATKMNRPWGQIAGCTARGFKWPFDNVASYYRIACDISGGHSGSPNWTDYPGNNGPYVIGIAMWEHCFAGECAFQPGDWKTHPSGFRGMTHYLANFITDKRVAYP